MAKINSKKPTSRKGTPPTIEEASNNLEVKKPQVEEFKLINFRVTASFRNELKIYAATKGISMTDLLYKMFEEYKVNHG